MLDTAAASATALLAILDDILDFSKIEAGKLQLCPEPFDVRGLVGQVMRLFEPLAREKGFALGVHVGPEVPVRVVADPVRFRQVLLNLLRNAVKFTERGGIEVRVSRVPGAEPVRIEVAVADTGIGIPPAQQEVIFAPFEQADATTTRTLGGTGLGLAISRRLVGLMGGRCGCRVRRGSAARSRSTSSSGRLRRPSRRRHPAHRPLPGRRGGASGCCWSRITP